MLARGEMPPPRVQPPRGRPDPDRRLPRDRRRPLTHITGTTTEDRQRFDPDTTDAAAPDAPPLRPPPPRARPFTWAAARARAMTTTDRFTIWLTRPAPAPARARSPTSWRMELRRPRASVRSSTEMSCAPPLEGPRLQREVATRHPPHRMGVRGPVPQRRRGDRRRDQPVSRHPSTRCRANVGGSSRSMSRHRSRCWPTATSRASTGRRWPARSRTSPASTIPYEAPLNPRSSATPMAPRRPTRAPRRYLSEAGGAGYTQPAGCRIMPRRRRRSIVIALDGLGIDLVRDAMSSGTVPTLAALAGPSGPSRWRRCRREPQADWMTFATASIRTPRDLRPHPARPRATIRLSTRRSRPDATLWERAATDGRASVPVVRLPGTVSAPRRMSRTLVAGYVVANPRPAWHIPPPSVRRPAGGRLPE